VDSFVADTPELVLARVGDAGAPPGTIACAAAPTPLVQAAFPHAALVGARSNADAARLVVNGAAEAGLTTAPAADSACLVAVLSFGTVPMAWIVFRSDDVPSNGRDVARPAAGNTA
jgi:hypothetical protein